MAWNLLAIVGAYLLGSILFGLLVCKALGAIDPRMAGSKNIGFTNVLRVSGKKAGILTLFGDIGKGAIATGLAHHLGFPQTWVLIFGFFVIFGHIFSVFLAFKGGKGVATAMGAVLGMNLLFGVYLIGIWIGMVFIFRYSSGGALGSFLAFPLIAFFFNGQVEVIIFSLSVLGLIIYGHTENISRLITGTEPKMSLFRT